MKIVSLTKSEKSTERYYVTFDGGVAKLTVTTDEVAKYSLYTNRELSDDEYLSLTCDAKKSASRSRALKILGQRNMSRREVIKRLTEKGDDAETAEATADWLERIGAVNDMEYASMIARHYSASGYGAAKVRDELYRRGVDRELWEDAMSKAPEPDGTLDSLIAAKLRSGEPDRAEIKRISNWLARRGFKWSDINSALRRYMDDIGEID